MSYTDRHLIPVIKPGKLGPYAKDFYNALVNFQQAYAKFEEARTSREFTTLSDVALLDLDVHRAADLLDFAEKALDNSREPPGIPGPAEITSILWINGSVAIGVAKMTVQVLHAGDRLGLTKAVYRLEYLFGPSACHPLFVDPNAQQWLDPEEIQAMLSGRAMGRLL